MLLTDYCHSPPNINNQTTSALSNTAALSGGGQGLESDRQRAGEKYRTTFPWMSGALFQLVTMKVCEQPPRVVRLTVHKSQQTSIQR